MTRDMSIRGSRPASEGGWPQERLIFCGVVASGLCLIALHARSAYVGRPALGFMSWNLFLAWVPLALNATRALINAGLRRVDLSARARLIWLAPLDAAWLLFLPNAPYLVTDLVHLSARPPVAYWFDLLMFCGFAATGCWLGVVSLEAALSRLRSPRVRAWASLIVCLACGYGVYLGRVWRLNSWDVLEAPLTSLLGPMVSPMAALFTLAFAGFFGLQVWAFHVVRSARAPS